jgi:hypothetical protein
MFFFTSPFFSKASDTLYYAGNIIISKKVSYHYAIRFVINPDNTLFGYSLTDAQGTNETKNKIWGRYDSINNTIYFEEHDVLRTKIDDKKNDMCFVQATLAFKKNKLIETLSGKFIGVQPGKSSPCGKGEIKLINTKKAKDILARAVVLRATATPVPEVKVINRNDFIKIFDATPRELLFTGSYLKLEAWDNGIIDGDKISITVNGKYFLTNYTVDSVKKVFEMRLQDNEIDTIVIIALNEGSSPPNTAAILIESLREQYPIEIQARQNEKRTIYLRRRKQK